MNMTEILKSAVERGASDIFVVAGLPLTYKVRGEQQRETADGAFTPEKTEAFAAEIYRLAAREPHCLNGVRPMTIFRSRSAVRDASV